MYKLVVSGFDGVLIDSEEAISAATILKIDQIRNNGVVFCVSTDRCLKEIVKYNHDFSFIDYIIACGGAYLYDVKKNKTIICKDIASFIVREIINNFSDYKVYGVSSDKRYLIRNFKTSKIYKLEIVCGSKKDLKNINDKLKELDLDISFWNSKRGRNYIVEITMKSINKCILIEKICSLEKISLNEVVGIGGGKHDASMFKLVGFKVAVMNADDALKKEADMITSSSDDGGVGHALEQLF